MERKSRVDVQVGKAEGEGCCWSGNIGGILEWNPAYNTVRDLYCI